MKLTVTQSVARRNEILAIRKEIAIVTQHIKQQTTNGHTNQLADLVNKMALMLSLIQEDERQRTLRIVLGFFAGTLAGMFLLLALIMIL